MTLIQVKSTWKNGFYSPSWVGVLTIPVTLTAELALRELIGSTKHSKTLSKVTNWHTTMLWPTTKLKTSQTACANPEFAEDRLKVIKICQLIEKGNTKVLWPHTLRKNWSSSKKCNEKKMIYLYVFFLSQIVVTKELKKKRFWWFGWEGHLWYLYGIKM